MTYLSWAALYEGKDDKAYFDVLIPRVMEEITLLHGTRTSTIPPNPAVTLSRGPVDKVASEACEAQEAFHLMFVHADTGGRNLEAGLEARSRSYCQAMHEKCDWPPRRCILISPRHETEAWILADPDAVTKAPGYSGPADRIGLPANAKAAEKLVDPKQVLADAANAVRNRNRPSNVQQISAAIAQRQSIELLRQSKSFGDFEAELHRALADLGCVEKLPN